MGFFASIKAAFSGLLNPGTGKASLWDVPQGRANNRRLGRTGESMAVTHLKKNGYRMVDSNYRAKTGEVDIICEEGGALVFVEVKMRRQRAFGPPQAAVDKRKQRKIARTAQHYLARTRQRGRRVRFDVLAITVTGGEPVFRIIKNAFDSPFR
ncbi:MAG: YraN family protein [Deltaproteobacteria bacterium]|nr:YraN family protein [Deltaproteobacteria bacterium]